MNRLNQLYKTLGFDESNGLFLIEQYEKWIHIFPYRISKLINEVIKPSAFFCIYGNKIKNKEHPNPFNKSFIFFFDRPTVEEEENIHKHIINFGLAQLVFINRDNTIDLYHGSNFEDKELEKLISSIHFSDFKNYSFINQLTGKVYESLGKKGKSIDAYLLNNIIDARRILVAKDGLNLLPKVANRLIGRLLFISYLIDRNVKFSDQNIIGGANKQERKDSFKALISNKAKIYDFFKYLTEKYDGDMFSLYEEKDKEIIYDEYAIVENKHLEILSHLFNSSSFFKEGKKFKNYSVQKSLFDLYDFEVISVELISSIYETFIGNKDDENDKLLISKQKEVKAYYTPPYIVDYILSQTVTPFIDNNKDSNCIVLDPSCGSGIFLVETLRKIIEKEISITNNSISDEKLWKLVKNNIFGIDIDAEAIDITIFSLYITILDYKKPAEIENFKFENLKNKNLFGGPDADFFNTQHIFNKIIKSVNFIIGNPPWGKVEKSKYIEYIKDRNKKERVSKKEDYIPLQIGSKEICQAFLVRASDFYKGTSFKCSFVITSKILYNSDSTKFRNYFLQNFKINQLLELSPINNKIRGGNHVFDTAKYPASIITYKVGESKNNIVNNIVQHITVKPNIFFLYYKTIVIEKQDVKNIKQRYFIEDLNGYDWLWKTLVFGNFLDFYFINRLKGEFKKVSEYGFSDYKGGFKLVDGEKENDASEILNLPYLDAKSGFRPYFISTVDSLIKHFTNDKTLSKKGKDNLENKKLGYIPPSRYFKGNKLLLKKGVVLEPNKKEQDYGEFHFGAVTAVSQEDLSFTSTIASLLPPDNNQTSIESLSNLSALFNSKLFTYYTLNTSPSLGVEKSRINFEEFLNFPAILDNKLGILCQSISKNKDNPLLINNLKNEIEKRISEIYKINEKELALIEYAMEVSIPSLLREENSIIFKALELEEKEKDKDFLQKYINIILKHFTKRFDRINKSLSVKVIYSINFLRINFEISESPASDFQITKTIDNNNNLIWGNLSFYQVCEELFIQQDVRGFTPNSFYIIKPNERKVWYPAIAYIDSQEIEDQIVKAEIKLMNKK